MVKGKGKSKEDEAVDQEEENSDLENAYLQTHKDAPKSDHEEEVDTEEPLVHESLQKGKKGSRSGPKAKFVPSDETPERRDQRTIFIGNLSVEVAQKKVRGRPFFFVKFCISTKRFSLCSSNSSVTSSLGFPPPR